ncbi:hypothetical protein EIP91_009575 [Steccherinum ochraceum]|uniref:Uncharacterized protein n=1 Tax=Steccherinum ochraceum TaxID=92696 RepID=A0A4R0RK70_9APHY|nr:hypothetical protein EIP91_009575 [Steccherinum ochraceum]
MTSIWQSFKDAVATLDPGPNARWGATAEPFVDYCQLRNNCTHLYKTVAPLGEILQMHSESLNAQSGTSVLAAAVAGNAADALEAGLRLWSGCSLDKDEDRAIECWMSIAQEKHQSGFIVPRRIRAHALSCLANAYWERSATMSNCSWSFEPESVYRATAFANESASLGFVSVRILDVGEQVRDWLRVAQHQIPDAVRTLYMQLGYLWAALKRYSWELEMMKHLIKDGRVPADSFFKNVCATEC